MIENTIFYFVLAFLSFFAFFAVKQDLVERKVSNVLTFSLFLFGFIFFVLNGDKLVWLDFGVVFFSFLISFLIYYKGI